MVYFELRKNSYKIITCLAYNWFENNQMNLAFKCVHL